MTGPLHAVESSDGESAEPVRAAALTDALRLPCGVVLPNRIAKAALTECLADPRINDPNARHERLYRRWAGGGVGLMVTGNVMVDRRYLERTSNVVIDERTDRASAAALGAGGAVDGGADPGAGEPPGAPVQRVRVPLAGGPVAGSLANRARFLLEAVRRTRAAVGPGAVVAVKLNSADFQRGGFEPDDAVQVARWLQDEGVDLLEISGGTYESPGFMGLGGPGASADGPEAYFLDFADGCAAKWRPR